MKNIMVVTGASSGIGMEFVKQISKENIDEIWVIGRNEKKLIELEKKVKIKVIPIIIDLSNKKEIKKYKDKLNKEQPKIILLGNFAGFGKFDHTENLSLSEKLNMIDVNVKAPVSMIDYSLPYMKENSKIINVASCAGFQPIPYINDYAATKAFLISYSRALNKELKYRNIHVMTVTPYWTKTNFFDRAIDDDNKKVVIKYDVMYKKEEVVKQLIKDLNKNKEMSVYGLLNKAQRLLVKILPHKLIMSIWMYKQKLDGTPNIRKD